MTQKCAPVRKKGAQSKNEMKSIKMISKNFEKNVGNQASKINLVGITLKTWVIRDALKL